MNTIKLLVIAALLCSGSCYSQQDSNKIAGDVISRLRVTDNMELDLSGKELKEFPPEVLEIKELITLDLSNNKLSSLPGDIAGLKHLRVLKINGNEIYELPAELIKLKFLKELYLDYDYWYMKLEEVKLLTRAKIFLK